jgi:hypothetical protein
VTNTRLMYPTLTASWRSWDKGVVLPSPRDPAPWDANAKQYACRESATQPLHAPEQTPDPAEVPDPRYRHMDLCGVCGDGQPWNSFGATQKPRSSLAA